MIEINSHSIRSRFITCIKEIPFLIYKFGGNGESTACLYIFLECAQFLQSLFQQNKTNVSFREIARLIARNSFILFVMHPQFVDIHIICDAHNLYKFHIICDVHTTCTNFILFVMHPKFVEFHIICDAPSVCRHSHYL